MTRLTTLFALILMTLVAFAQDVIVTMDAKKIDAKIIEVSKSQIKYKESDNLDGPVFVMETTEINTIIYANGKVVLYNSEPEKTSVTSSTTSKTITPSEQTVVVTTETNSPEPDNTATIILRNGETMLVQITGMNRDGVTYVQNGIGGWMAASKIDKVVFANGQIKSYTSTGQLQQNNSSPAKNTTNSEIESVEKIYTAAEFKGDYLPKFTYTKVDVPGKKHQKKRYVGGNMVLTEKEFAKFLEMHCPEAYNYYSKSVAMLICECVSILIGLIPVIVFMAVGLSFSAKILPTYNAQCATNPITTVELENVFQDNIKLATFHSVSLQE